MKCSGKRGRTRSRSPGKKARRRRAAKALAAAGAIAGGTQAYALPVRFENPDHGEAGHFHWVGPMSTYVWLDYSLGAEEQPAPAYGPTAVGQRVFAAKSNLAALRQELQGDADEYLAVGVPAETLIPTDGYVWRMGPYICYAPGYGSACLIPEGQRSYLGVRFDLGSGYQYAWIGVVRSGVELEAFAWGRERVPGVPIPAGALSQGACFAPEGCLECTKTQCEAMGGKYYRDGMTCEEAGDIPTVSEWGLAIMALALLAAGTWVVKKRVPQPQPSEA